MKVQFTRFFFPLEPPHAVRYARRMKRISLLIFAIALFTNPAVRGQDAATEERLNQLSGKIEDLIASQETQRKRIAELAREIDGLRDLHSKPNSSYASQDDLKRLAEKLQEIEKNREHDKDLILKEIGKIGKAVAVPNPPARRGSGATPSAGSESVASSDKTTRSEKGFDYVIKSGDTYSVIAQACREQGIKVTPDQIEKANPGVKPTSLRVGQKIFIPAPPP